MHNASIKSKKINQILPTFQGYGLARYGKKVNQTLSYLRNVAQTRYQKDKADITYILRVWQCLFYISCTLLGHAVRQGLLYHSCTLLGPRSLGMAMSNLLFLYLAGPYPWNVNNVRFLFLHYVLALCMIYIYIYIYALYDGLSWLGEQPSHDHGYSWPCIVGMCSSGCCRCILMLYCVHRHCIMFVSIHVS